MVLPDSVWGPRSEGFSSGSEDEDINSGSSRNKKWTREQCGELSIIILSWNFILRVLTNIFVLFQSWIELWSLIFMWVPFYLSFFNCTKILELFLFTMQIKVHARAHHHIFTYLDHEGKQYGQGRNQSISWHCKAPYCPNFERCILTILFMSSYFQDSNGWDAKRLCATFLITQKISRPIHSALINPRLYLGASWRMKHCLPIEDWFLIQNCNNCQMTALFQEA